MVKSRLKVILVERQISQTYLAKRIGISITAVNAICNEKSTPTLEVALNIASALGVSVHDIWTVN